MGVVDVSESETLVQVIQSVDIPREWTLRQVIDELVNKTNWEKFEAMLVALDEGDFRVEISVYKKEDQ